MRVVLALLLGFLTSPVSFAAPVPNGNAHGLTPRHPIESTFYILPADTPVSRVVVKLHEGTRVRLRDQGLTPLDRNERERAAMVARGLTEAQLHKDLAAIHRLAAQESLARGLDRLFKQDEALLAERRQSGEAKSGRELADLDLYFEIPLPAGTTQGEVTGFVAQLAALPSVEVAYAEPVPEPAQAATPNLQGNQGYLNAAPAGIDALYSWTFSGGRGQGTRIVDVELNMFDELHEDLPSLFYRDVMNPTLNEHGTNVMGVMLARDNGIGVTGIAHGAQAGFQTTQDPNTIDPQTLSVADALNRAATAAGPLTGVVVIEIQARGPVNPTCTCNIAQCGHIAIEFWQANYDVIDTATANGTNVVEAAGNGSANLDAAGYGRAFDRTARDSWAILVGASGGANATQDLTAVHACYTNFGSRVDLRAWGENVATTGPICNNNGCTANLADNGPHRQYTASFSGTSSATPIVAGALADVQGFHIASGWGSAGPLVLRQLLVDTGTPQDATSRQTRPIGPQPNLRAAIDSLRRHEGYLDGASCTAVWGWAWDRNLPNTPINVDVLINGALFTTTTANVYRADLASAGKGNGSHGFNVSIPNQQGRRVISTRYSGTGVNLGKSSKAVYCNWGIFTNQTPASYLAASPGYEVGTQFSSKWGGSITALRFYEAPGETGNHTLKLWADTGGTTPLRQVTIPATGTAGWREAAIPSYTISPRTKYRVTVNANTMHSKTSCGPGTPNYPIYNDPFTAHTGFWGTAGAFPNTGSCGIYFVDVVFNSTQ